MTVPTAEGAAPPIEDHDDSTAKVALDFEESTEPSETSTTANNAISATPSATTTTLLVSTVDEVVTLEGAHPFKNKSAVKPLPPLTKTMEVDEDASRTRVVSAEEAEDSDHQDEAVGALRRRNNAGPGDRGEENENQDRLRASSTNGGTRTSNDVDSGVEKDDDVDELSRSGSKERFQGFLTTMRGGAAEFSTIVANKVRSMTASGMTADEVDKHITEYTTGMLEKLQEQQMKVVEEEVLKNRRPSANNGCKQISTRRGSAPATSSRPAAGARSSGSTEEGVGPRGDAIHSPSTEKDESSDGSMDDELSSRSSLKNLRMGISEAFEKGYIGIATHVGEVDKKLSAVAESTQSAAESLKVMAEKVTYENVLASAEELRASADDLKTSFLKNARNTVDNLDAEHLSELASEVAKWGQDRLKTLTDGYDDFSAAEARRVMQSQFHLLIDLTEQLNFQTFVRAFCFGCLWVLILAYWCWRGATRPLWITPIFLTWFFLAMVFFGVRFFFSDEHGSGRTKSIRTLRSMVGEALVAYNTMLILMNAFIFFSMIREVRRLQNYPSFFASSSAGGASSSSSSVEEPLLLPEQNHTTNYYFWWFDHILGGNGLGGWLWNMLAFLPRVLLRFLCEDVLGWNPAFFTAWIGNGRSFRSEHLQQLVWLHYQLHIGELMDTAFLILRQRFDKMMSSLHTWLKLVNIWSWFFAVMFCPYGDVCFVVLVNSFTSLLVYTYYMLAMSRKWQFSSQQQKERGGATGGRQGDDVDGESAELQTLVIDRGLEWLVGIARKNRVVLAQMTQFVILFTHACWSIFFGQMPISACLWQLTVMAFSFLLYADFHTREDEEQQDTVDLPLGWENSPSPRDVGGGATSTTASSVTCSTRSPSLSPQANTQQPQTQAVTATAPTSSNLGTIDQFLRNRKPQLVFSFDSSGWLYSYHFGVAFAIESYFGRLTDENLAKYNRTAMTRVSSERDILTTKWEVLSRNSGSEEETSPPTSTNSGLNNIKGRGASSPCFPSDRSSSNTSKQMNHASFNIQSPSPRSSPSNIQPISNKPSASLLSIPKKGPGSCPANLSTSCTNSTTSGTPGKRDHHDQRPQHDNMQVVQEEQEDEKGRRKSSCSSHSSASSTAASSLSSTTRGAVSNKLHPSVPKSAYAPKKCRADDPWKCYGRYDDEFVEDLANPACLGYSGSSGGAVVGAALACGIPILPLFRHVLEQRCWAYANPQKAIQALEMAMDKFLGDPGLYKRANGRIRILQTRVRWRPPIFSAQISSHFKTTSHLWHALRASAHVPLAAGILPYRVTPKMMDPDSKPGLRIKRSTEWFIDGLIWFSFLVPWRTFHKDDHCVKVSALTAPTAHIAPSKIIPPWWALFPPSEKVLEGIFWSGFLDAEAWFKSGRAKHGTAKYFGGSDSQSARELRRANANSAAGLINRNHSLSRSGHSTTSSTTTCTGGAPRPPGASSTAPAAIHTTLVKNSVVDQSSSSHSSINYINMLPIGGAASSTGAASTGFSMKKASTHEQFMKLVPQKVRAPHSWWGPPRSGGAPHLFSTPRTRASTDASLDPMDDSAAFYPMEPQMIRRDNLEDVDWDWVDECCEEYEQELMTTWITFSFFSAALFFLFAAGIEMNVLSD